MEKPDSKTQKLLSDGEKLALLLESEAWPVVKELLQKRIDSLDKLTSIDFNDDGWKDSIRERASVAMILRDWIEEIEGSANSYISQASGHEDTEDVIKFHK